MEFCYENYQLRKPIKDDAKGLMEITRDKEAMLYYGTSGAYFEKLEDAEKEIEWFCDLFNNNCGRWIITDKEDNKYIGDIGFFSFDKEHNKVEMGYKIKKEYWGKGIMSNIISQLICYGFNELNYNRIEALVDTRNTGSKKVLLKNNFFLEGTLREYELEHGNYVDLEIYSLLKREFANLSKRN